MTPRPADAETEKDKDWVEPEVRRPVVARRGVFSLAELVNSESFPRYLLIAYFSVCGALLGGVVLSFVMGDTGRYRNEMELAHRRDAALVELPKRFDEDEKELHELTARVHQLEHRKSGPTTLPPAPTSRGKTTPSPKVR